MANLIVFCSIFLAFYLLCNIVVKKVKGTDKLLNSDKVINRIMNSFK